MAQPSSRPAIREDLPKPGEVITFDGYTNKHYLVIIGMPMRKGINNILAKAFIPLVCTEAVVTLNLEIDDLYSVYVTALTRKLIKEGDGDMPDEYEVTAIVEKYNTLNEHIDMSLGGKQKVTE
jgi:hypothetical protein